MTDIFISYSSTNRAFALRIAERLEQFFDVWIDREGIEGGMEWEEAIVAGVTNCTVFVVIVTPQSNESDWVARETILAEQLKKFRVPILLDGDLPFRLLNLHYIDFQGEFEGGFLDLLEALNKHLEPRDKTREAVNHLLGEAIRAQLDSDVSTARNFVGQALAIQPDLSDNPDTFWDNLIQSPKTHDADLVQQQLDAGLPIVAQQVRRVSPNPYGEKHQAYVWKMYLQLDDTILDKIDYVQYNLHPTFPNPERIIRDKKSNFRLKFVGWGIFEIPITIEFKDGSSIQTRHDLTFPT